MSFNFKKYVRVLLVEQTWVNLSKSVSVTFVKAKKLINDLKAGRNRFPKTIKIDGCTFEKVGI